MNILVPYNWLKEYTRTNLQPEEFAAQFSLSGASIERWWSMDQSLDGVVVGEILEIRKHPNADKLSLAKVDVGKDKPIQLIFGQMVEMHTGDKVPVALAPTTLPNGQKIEKAKLRGETSEGMLCLDQELGFVKEGKSMRYFDKSVKNGLPISKALELDDTIFEIEVTSNRPDMLGVVGLAREASAILESPFLWKPVAVAGDKPPRYTVDIKIDAPKLCSRYQAAVLQNVRVKPSPWWLQRRLLAAGVRPINNIVDITNYVMLEIGQPMHAFDADLLTGEENKKTIIVREAKKGEKMKALDENIYELDSSMLVIADSKKAVAIAGVMGGEETGVNRDTTTIIFESANFDPVSVRKTSRALNLQSDSSLRFEKGLSTESTTSALARAVELTLKLTSAELVTPLLDRRTGPYRHLQFSWTPEASRKLIGQDLDTVKMKKILESLGFETKAQGRQYQVRVPYWRDHDIEASVDFTEEIARIYGYHKLPSVIPEGELPMPAEDSALLWEDKLREAFCGAGFTEVYSYSFVSKELLQKGNWDVPVLEVQNPLTEDLAVMRPSLVPSLLQIVAENENQFPEAKIFEIANIYLPRSNDLPIERLMVAGVLWGEGEKGELFFKAKGMIEGLKKKWNIDVMIIGGEAAHKVPRYPGSAGVHPPPLGHPGRRAVLTIDGKEIGMLGEAHPLILEQFGIKHRVALFQFDALEFFARAQGASYKPISEFPGARRDISFYLPRKTAYDEVVKVTQEADERLREIELFDVYEGKDVPEDKKSMALHLEFADPTRTLTGDEVDEAFSRITKALESKLKAEVRIG